MSDETNMILAKKKLDRMVDKIPDEQAFFRGLPAEKFDREDLIKLCKVFSHEWFEAQSRYFQILRSAGLFKTKYRPLLDRIIAFLRR